MSTPPDLGAPASYRTAARGLPVYSTEREEIGTLTHVLADDEEDVFDGIVVDTSIGAGGSRFVDAEDVGEFYEQGVVLGLMTTQCGDLKRPEPAPATLEARGDEPPPGPVSRRLHRAWDLISGND